MKRHKNLWILLGILILLSPLGLIVPAHLNSGSAWGEWDIKEVQKQVEYTPSGMKKTSDTWNAPMPDYAFKGQENVSMQKMSLSYILSGIAGVAVIVVVSVVIGKALAKHEAS